MGIAHLTNLYRSCFMNNLIYTGATFFLAVAFSIPAAYANENIGTSNVSHLNADTSKTGACENIPPARPTGGASLARLQALQECYKGLPQGKVQQFSRTGACANIPPAEPTGGATSARLQALQRCYKEMGANHNSIPIKLERVNSFPQQNQVLLGK